MKYLSGLLIILTIFVVNINTAIASASSQESIAENIIQQSVAEQVYNVLSVVPSSSSLTVNSTQQLQVTLTNSQSGSETDVTNSCSYISANQSIATVSSSGLITAVSVGNTNISITYKSLTTSVPVTVTTNLKSILADPSNISIAVGSSQQLQIISIDNQGNTNDVTSNCTFTSNSTSIAQVTSQGLAEAESIGSTTITVSYQGLTTNVNVNVTGVANNGNSSSSTPIINNSTVSSISTNESSYTIDENQTEQLTVTANLSSGSTYNITQSSSYSSSNSNIASVSSSGLITGIGVGTTTITVSYSGLTATVSVQVDNLIINPSTVTINAGDSQQLIINIENYDGTITNNIQQNCTYSIVNTNVANINSQGLVEGISGGSTTATITYNSLTTTLNITVTGSSTSTNTTSEKSLKIEFPVYADYYTINGSIYKVDTVGTIYNNRALIAVRYLANSLGITDNNIIWDSGNKIVVLKGPNNINIGLQVGLPDLYVFNGSTLNKTVEMDVCPIIKESHVLLPARYVAEQYNFNVSWDNVQKAVSITNDVEKS